MSSELPAVRSTRFRHLRRHRFSLFYLIPPLRRLYSGSRPPILHVPSPSSIYQPKERLVHQIKWFGAGVILSSSHGTSAYLWLDRLGKVSNIIIPTRFISSLNSTAHESSLGRIANSYRKYLVRCILPHFEVLSLAAVSLIDISRRCTRVPTIHLYCWIDYTCRFTLRSLRSLSRETVTES